MAEGIGTLIRPWVRKYVTAVALNGVPVRTPQIDSVTKNWLVFNPVSNVYVSTGVSAEGRAPEIGANGNWWIGGVDTGTLAEGGSVESITNAEIQNILNNS